MGWNFPNCNGGIKMKKNELTLVVPKWMDIIIHIERGNNSKIARETNITPSYFHQVCGKLVDKGFLNVERRGRER